MYYPDEVIGETRMRNDVVDVISGHVKPQKKRVSYFGLCPFYDEKSPSFSVLPEKQVYYCSSCGAGGDVITFLVEYENYTFQEALSSLADRVGVNLPKMEYSREVREQAGLGARLLEVNKLAANYLYYQMRQPQDKTTYDYFHLKRGLADETIVHFRLRYSNRTSNDLYRYLKGEGYEDSFLRDTDLVTLGERGGRDKLWNCVVFPIIDANSCATGFDGRVMGDEEPKYLNSPEAKLFDKSHDSYDPNHARLSREGYLLICEGYLDVISLHQVGFTNTVVSLGAAFTSQHANMLRRYTDQVILTYDSGGTGMRAALRVVPILKEVGMSIRALNMKSYKDPDEFIKNMGVETLRQRIGEAKDSFLFEVDALRQGYKIGDPKQRARLYQEAARKLLQFGEALERENYPQAVAREQVIPIEELRDLVNRMGMSMGLKAGESLNHSDRVVPQETQEGESGGSGLSDSRKPRWPDKGDGIHHSQRLPLTWLIGTPTLFEKIEGTITTDGSIENLYHQVVQMVFDGHREGNLNPIAIPSRFINDEGQYKEATALFNTSLKESLNGEEQKKAFLETVMRVRRNSLDAAGRNAKGTIQLQEIIRQQAALKQLYISLD